MRRQPKRTSFRPRWQVWLVLALAAVAAKLYNDSAHTPPSTGPGSFTARVSVADGDSLRSGKLRLRLVNIDAPELNQCCKNRTGRLIRCGEISKSHLQSLIANRTVTCSWSSSDPNGRPLATCRIGNLNLNARMVADGQAIAYRRFLRRSQTYRVSSPYRDEETAAKNARNGLHSYSAIEPPHIYRENQRNQKPPRIAGC